ncbi:MAG: hypothetical protein WD851_23330 [Pirellulales bacterium]
MATRFTFRGFQRAVARVAWFGSVTLVPVAAGAAIVSSGDVKPPFALFDTPGSTKVFTVPTNPSSTNGGVFVGDVASGRLDIDNAWTLNSTFGVLGNTSTSSFPNGSELYLAAGSTWNVRFDPDNPVFVPPDFDIGREGLGIAHVNLGSTLSVEWQTRLGTLPGGNGQLHLGNSTLSTGSLVVGAAGGGTLSAGLSTVNAGFIEVGREATGNGLLTLSGGAVNTAGGVTLGIGGSGTLDAFNGTTIASLFLDLGRDFNFPDGPSPSATSIGTVTLSGPGTTWQNELSAIVALNTRGSLTIEDGATLTTGYLEVSRFGNDGNLTVDNATLTMAMNSSFTNIPALIIGTASGSVGHATFTGQNTAVTVADGGFLEVARDSADSSLNVGDGADVSTHHTIIATGAGSLGVLNLSGTGTTWTGSGFFEVGRSGQGTLNVFDGATVSSDTGHIAVADTSLTSSANITGYGSRWTTADFVTVGEAGTGSLIVSDGASVDIGDFLSLGNSAGGTGTLDVSGSAPDPESPGNVVPSTVTSAYQIAVGHLGDGFAVVHDGARLVSNKADSPTGSSGILGHFADAEGMLEVQGNSSLWTGDGAVNVGFRGTGTLNVKQGGRVESVDGVLARLPGSTGTVALTGDGSAWFVQDALYVGGRPTSLALGDEGTAGPGGAATLSVGTGSYVTVGNTIEIFDAGAIDVSMGGSVTVGEGDPEAESGTLHVYTGGSLLGSGSVQGNVINQGTVAPGNSPGILTINGNYTQSSGAALVIEIAGTTPGDEFDVLNITGDASLASGSTLLVQFIDDFVPQSGDTFEFLAVGGDLSGAFSTVTLPSLSAELTWNVSQLYANGALSVTLVGDYNNNGTVDAADYTVWRDTLGSTTNLAADGNGNNVIDAGDYGVWKQNFGRTSGTGSGGMVPEPTALVLLCATAIALLGFRLRSVSSGVIPFRRLRAGA